MRLCPWHSATINEEFKETSTSCGEMLRRSQINPIGGNGNNLTNAHLQGGWPSHKNLRTVIKEFHVIPDAKILGCHLVA
jgi:hypothetical protein